MKKIIFLSILVIIGILFTAQIKRGFVSVLILADTVRSPKQSMMEKFISGPDRKTVTVTRKGRTLPADLYVPQKKGRHVPLLLVHGVNHSGKDDRQLVLLAQNLARAGFLVLVPDFVGMKNLHLSLADAEDVLASYLFLKKHDRAGHGGAMIGISYGAGPVLLAAADARIRDKVSVIATFGGYYDLRNVLLFSMTGSFEYGSHRGYVRPEQALRWMLVYKNADILRDAADREKFKKIVEQRNRYEFREAASLAATLGPDGRAVYAFLINTDHEKFLPLYENLPLSMRERVYQLSSSRAVKYIKASFIIAHAMDDFSIPYTESLRLEDAMEGPGRVRKALLPQFLGSEPLESSAENIFKRYVVGGWRLFSVIYALLEEGGLP